MRYGFILSERVSTKGSHRMAHVRRIGRPSAKTISAMLLEVELVASS